ncbi:hypothetical protein Tco_0464338 [Tanacetum coccineum]
MTTLAEFMIIVGAENRPPMLEKSIYDSWKSRMEIYIENRENRRMILNSVLNGLLVWPTIVKENGTTRTKKYEELSVTEKLQVDCDLKATNIVLQGDDPIACLNKAMAFLSAVAASRFHSTNNQLRTTSNPRNQTTIQDGRVIVQQYQRGQGQSYDGTGYKGDATSYGGNNAGGHARVVKSYNCQCEGHIARQCTQPKRPRNAAWFKEKAMLAEAQESGQILDEEQLAFLVDPCILDGQAAQTTIPNTNAFQTEDLDAYDYDCDDVSNAKAVLMDNLSNYGSNVILEVPHSEPCHHDMDNQSVHAMQHFEQTPVVAVQDTNLYAQQDLMILFVIEQMSEQMINHVNNKEKANKETNNESPTLYDGSVISSQHAASPVIDDEETLILVEVGRSKMLAKQNEPISKEKKVNTTPINYVELNRLSGDFGKRFVPQQECLLNKLSGYKLHTCSVDKQCFEIHKKELFLENDRLLHQIMPQDVMICVMNSTAAFNDVNLEMRKSESCNKCLDLDAELLNKQNTDNQNALEILKYFENNDLKAQLQAKDTTICKLKEHIKSIRENNKEEKVKQEMDKIETINIKLEHKHCDSLIAQLNSKSMENADLKGQIREKVFVTTTLQNELRRLKGKLVLDNATTITNATTIAPGMFKLDIKPLSHRLKNNKDAHEDYLKKTIENTDTIRGLIERAIK